MQREIIQSFRLSPRQKRLGLLQQADQSEPYRTQCAVLIEGDLKTDILKKALERVVDKHETLRTAFRCLPEMTIPVQVMTDKNALWRSVDLSSLDHQAQASKIEEILREEGGLAFEFEDASLAHTSLVILSPAKHVLLVSLPAHCADACTLKNLVGEIGRSYAACLHDEELFEEPMQHADFSSWQDELLEAKDTETGKEYWRKRGVPALLAAKLPFETEPAGESTFEPELLSTTIDPDTATKIEELVSKYGASPSTFLQACWQVLLWRFTGQAEMIIGTAYDGRKYEHPEEALGLYAKYLPVECHLRENLRFNELLNQVSETTSNVYKWQEYFAWEQVGGSTAGANETPFFPLCFEFAQRPPKHLAAGISFSIYKQDACIDRYKVKLSCIGGDGALTAEFHYDPALFRAEDIEHLAGNFHTLLESVITNPEATVSELNILSDIERQQVLFEFNDTKADYVENKCIHELIEEQVARTPEALAVTCEGEQLTYSELNRRANQLAHYLRKLGVGPEVLVGICMDRSVEMVVGLLGILKAGGAYVPLDPEYPKERLSFMLEDAEVPVLLAQGQLVEGLPEHKAEVVRVDSGWGKISLESVENPASGVTAENAAYVIYTSGSTGQPKGAINKHGGIRNRLLWMQDAYQLTQVDRVLQKTPFSFDVSVWEFFWPLLTGARLVVARPGGHRDSAYLVKLISEQQITTLHFVPSMLRVFLEATGLETCGSLRQVMCSGEALPFELQERFFVQLNAELHNLYGPTEAAVDVTFWACERASERRIVPIGRPIANTQIYILDSHLQPVPIGVPGELHIGGVGLARGYLNRPELTAEKFIPDPFSAEADARLYKTGDLARYLPDGNIEYLGRIDHQVKVRGFRIELGEIEAVLSQHPAVREAVVIAREDMQGDKQLVAYVVQNPRYQGSDERPPSVDLHDEQISQWQMVYDGIYSQTAPHQDPTFNTIGWNSSYTGMSIPAEEMREWVDHTVERILHLRTSRVLEIGCGTGMLLFRVAPHCTQYRGTDFSRGALDYVRGHLAERDLPQVTLSQRMADDFDGIAAESFDTVVVNSVVQLFPSIDYLVRVLEGAVNSLAPGGAIYVGDVRSLPLLEAFHTSVQLHQAPATLPTEQLRQRIRKYLAQEDELVIDPAFFTALKQHLPKISHVQIQLKRGQHHNELTRFRYDVILHIGPEVYPTIDPPRMDWQQQKLNLSTIRQLLVVDKPDMLNITRVPNARLLKEVKALDLLASCEAPETVDDLREALQEIPQNVGVEPEDVWALGHDLPYSVNINWSGSGADGCYDVVFRRHTTARAETSEAAAASVPGETVCLKPWSEYASNPLEGKFVRKLAPELRDHLKEKLPEYMVPAAFVLLSALPLTSNGKVNRGALPAPDLGRPELEKAYVAPRSELEHFLAGIWQEVLGIEGIGIYDNFFELGGDSIQGAVLINKLQENFGEFVYLVALFDAPTIAALAVYLSEHYSDAVFKICRTESLHPINFGTDQGEKIDSFKVTQMRQLITPLPPREQSDGATISKNPPAIFVLAPPRSGTTLLRVMLAGHPLLFAPPELELLNFNTLEERKAVFSGRYGFQLEGAIRAIMEIKSRDAEQAKSIIADCENQKLTTQQFYGLMQEWIGEKILVDKTPPYALDLEVLKRAETDFDNPLYIHLLRHPYGMIRSFEEAKFDQVFLRYKHPFSLRELAELIWLISHQNILEFLKQVPDHRQYRMKFEDLVDQPSPILEEMCQFLGLEFHPDMLQPYKDKEKKMTDGVHTISKMLGDVKFHEHKNIDSQVADRWKEFYADDFLGDITWQVAETLGYENFKRSKIQLNNKSTVLTERGPTTIQPIPRGANTELPLSFAQQRLWFLDQLEPGSPVYNVPAAIRLKGPLNVSALERALGEVLRRHEALRTTFSNVKGKPVQVISPAPPPAPALSVVDLRGLPETERGARVLSLATKEARQTFDLARSPLLRSTLMRLSEEDHVLLLVTHHIACDGWSIGVLFRELATLYTAFTTGEAIPIAPLPIQYADFARWQRQWLQGEVLEEQLSYWKQRLAGAPAVLELPTDRSRPAVQTFKGARQSIVLPKGLSESLKALSQREGVTLFMTLLAAFKTLLYRYTGQEDIVVGSPMAGRNRAEIERLIGFFVNNLVLRTNLSGEPTFRELLRRVREVALGAYAHQDVPFEKLVEELQPERDLGRSPLFQVSFNLLNYVDERLEIPGLSISPLKVDNGTTKFDLTLFMVEGAEGLRGWLEYNEGLSGWVEYRTDLFEAATITRMLGHLETLLEGIIADPDQRLSELPLLTEADRYQLLVGRNDTRVDYLKDKCIHELFEGQAESTPDAVAVVFEDEQLTYSELNRRANQLAHYLRKLGVGPEVLVGICVERSVEMVVGLLGILKAGAAYVPLDPEYPKERLSFMLEDAEVPVLLTQERLVEGLPEHNAEVICLDTGWEAIKCEGEWNPIGGATADDLAYVIYTSGSTGRPKGVQIMHQAVVNFLNSMRQRPGLVEEDTVLSVTTLSFDIAALELYLPLIVGARLVMVSREVASDGRQLWERLSNSGATMMQATPATWRLLLQAGWQGSPQLKILCGGEALSLELASQLLVKGSSLWNLYGPTETTIWSAVHKIESERGPVVIGSPIANTQIHILDRHLNPVPISVPGELYIGGDGLARGYLNRPELTAEKFIQNPFSRETGARLYKTGDLARYLADGNIEFLGRIDHQVKVRGFRIELGEIEAVLAGHEGVRETVVVAREDEPGEKRLVAYLVAAQETAPTVSELRSLLKGRLPEYMVPSAFVVLDELPLTPNGKVDRRALPAPDHTRPELEEAFVAPRTPVEEVVAGIWAEVLGMEQVGIHDNFFELGGHSLKATQVVSRVREAFQVELPLRSLFESPTVAELALAVTQSQGERKKSTGVIKRLNQANAEQLLAKVDLLPEEKVDSLLSGILAGG